MAQPLSPVTATRIMPVSGTLPAVPKTRHWLVATVISALTTTYFAKKFVEAQKYQCILCPKVSILGMHIPQMRAIFLTAAACFFLVGLFSVSMLLLTRRVEQFMVD